MTDRTVPSSELGRRYGVSAVRLLSWDRRAWVAPTTPRRGPGLPLRWAVWAQRMVGVLSSERTREPPSAEGARLLHMLAVALRRDPEAPWFVDTGAGKLDPAESTAAAVELALSVPGPLRRLVSPPPPLR